MKFIPVKDELYWRIYKYKKKLEADGKEMDWNEVMEKIFRR